MLPVSPPSRQSASLRLTLWATAIRLLWGLLLSAWLLLGLGWALLHGWIVPRIDQFRPQLQALATQATGLQVEIGELAAQSVGIFPSFELRQVRLIDAQGRTALELPQVLVALSPRSLMTLELEQLVIRGADLDVRRTSEGHFMVAGMRLSPQDPPHDQVLADWLLAQPEWALLDGTVRWTDEQQQVSMVLTQVDAVMRNPGHKHQLRIDATPPAQWGDRFSLRGHFKEPLLGLSSSDWRRWSGELYGEFSRVDIASLQTYAHLAGAQLDQGHGALRAWVDIAKGRIVGTTADVMLDDAQARLAPQLQPLAFKRVAGRLGWNHQGARVIDVYTQSLSFELADGLQWPGGNVALHLNLDAQDQATGGRLKADKLDLQALAAISQRLPLQDGWRRQLQAYKPQGLVEQLELSWEGPPEQPVQASAKGRVSGLWLAAEADSHRPGVAGLSLDFQLQRQGGEDKAQATVLLERGWLEFPGYFAEPRLPLDTLSGELRVKRDARGLEVELRQGQLASPDAQGQFQGSWKQATGGDPRGRLDLQGQLRQAHAARVWRYLPLALPDKVRDYVREAVTEGELGDVRVKVKGPLSAFPFDQSREGEFQVSAKLRRASYAYVPPSLSPAAKPWPALTNMDAELLFDKASLHIRKAQARVAGQPGLQVGKAEAHIANLKQATVEVSGEVKGPLAQALAVIHRSPLAELTGQVLARSTATGPAEAQLKFSLPLQDLERSKVQGSVTLAGNDLQLSPEAPAMSRVRGRVGFTENSFQVTGGQARMLGGDVRFDGGMRPLRKGESPELSFKGQGTASAEGLQQWSELAALAPLLKRASGSAAYSAELGWRQGVMELGVSSTLAGLGLALPEPLHKAANASLPLRLDKTLVRDTPPGRRPLDRLSLQLGPGAGLGRPVYASYLRDLSGTQAQVLGGQILIGVEREAEPPVREVRARVQLARVDLDAWEPVLGLGTVAAPGDGGGNAGLAYLPTSFSLRTDLLKWQGHSFQDVVLGGKREGGLWSGNLNASELSGYAEFRQPSGSTPGRLFARLSRLSLGSSTASQVEALLENQPSSIPALDIVVDDLELRGKRLGRLEVEAVNRNLAGREATREWRLNKLNLSVPEATLSATGSWAALPEASARPGHTRRGTNIQFRLDVADAGELLKRLGQDGAIRRGKGRLDGQLSWAGSPLGLHYPSLGGQLNVDVETGQFLKAEPGVAKLLGVLNLQALPRRLTLDFRDVFSEGFAFDWIRGDVAIAQGVATTRNLRMKGVNAAVVMDGSADLARETQDLRVLVVPEFNAGTASLLAYAVNPTVALGSFLAQWLLRQPLGEAATQEFQIKGSWQDPHIQRVTRQRPGAEAARPPGGPPMKVAALQMVSSHELRANLACAADLVAQAAEQGAELVLLPEYFCLLGHSDRDKLAVAERAGSGPIQDMLAEAAHRHQLWIAGGTLPLATFDAARVRNSTLVFNPAGEQVARYDKIHLFRFSRGQESYDESRTLERGQDTARFALPSRDGHRWQVGLSVCYDLRFPELYRRLDADLLLVPSAFTHTTGQAHWEVLLRARAIENLAFVAAAAQGGLHDNGRRTWGHSMLVDPWGQVLAQRAEGPGVVLAELDPSRLAEVRAQLPALAHRVLP